MTDATFWTRGARRYSERPVPDEDAYAETLSRTAHHLHREDRMLELGCGTGMTALRLAPHVAHLTAIDYAQGMIDIAREKAWEASVRNVAFEVAEPGADALLGQRFDVVAAFNLLHLMPDPRAALAHVARYLEPGGLFISKTPCLAGLGLRSGFYRAIVMSMRAVGFAPAVTFFSVRDWHAMIDAAGFEIIERGTYPSGGTSRFVVARLR
ncbi:bifunctional 2-polyprenyl-6-hydroxyphenol methylase/3-demethylubiquinol 3-O-methyltransferase UbiG [uncultured Jannaschia sp.]|uniref:class I SAM-dependent methyltransferase n=1 Tax=uncultured Jannaschia sp. TaxID=293347 RepID=UPI002625511B|nr:class I SAM-dependent methyltransferase [uncultured Jannaschia sp.]